ncbi:MAG: DUF4846 domain-containing protein, partial [Adhaeribacter sp.]
INGWKSINPDGKTIATRISPPPGFERVQEGNQSLNAFLRNLPVKENGAGVNLYNGKGKNRQDVHAAVIKMDVGQQDLQQCADAVMRLRAEYLFKQKKYAEIHFNFTSGDRADYLKYAQGFRPLIQGNRVSWKKKAAADNSYGAFRKYLNLVFTYAGTASLEKELQQVKNLADIRPGDVLIQGGHPGHALMVMDVAVNPQTKEKVFLLAQSYMPAQEMHIVKNFNDPSRSPWYSAKANSSLNTPEWDFEVGNLRRFPKW